MPSAGKASRSTIPSPRKRAASSPALAGRVAVRAARAAPSVRSTGLTGSSLLTDFDIFLFKQGRHFRLYEKMGAHLTTLDGVEGTHFAVWAPNAERVSVVGDFNGWDPERNSLRCRPDDSGIWEGFLPGLARAERYKYHVWSRFDMYRADKGDPYALYWEVPPRTASVVWSLDYEWNDREWMDSRYEHNALDKPMSIYEVHLGSWRRASSAENDFLGYRELAHQLVAHMHNMGFTHVELTPVMEHPLYRSWGYQTTGYFAPTSRFGTPQDFMYFVDYLHRNGIGVILDWVPSHFPSDEHGPGYFDGTHLYEHSDPRQGFHPDWKSFIFNYGRNEVRAFLMSSAFLWLDKYHVDGLRVDAVASMLYLDYSRKQGEWIPNDHGGRENLEAISFLRTFNEEVYKAFPDVQTIAEESTAWPMVSRPIYLGGLGFGLKWNMGWMHDTLSYFAKDPVHRKYHQNDLTFSMLYAFSENFVLPFSHDEVVHLKGSLLNKMPCDGWQRFSNLRLLLGYQWTHPGKKLLFMGGEWGQWGEWNHDASLDWHQTYHAPHQGVLRWVADINRFYRNEPALYERDFDWSGFDWISCTDYEQSVVSFMRRSKDGSSVVVVVCNFTPVARVDYVVGVPRGGYWKEVLNSDASEYWGSGVGNLGGKDANPWGFHGQPHSLTLTLPPVSILVLKPGQ